MMDGATMRTGLRSAARIVFRDGSVIEMAASTEVSIGRIALKPTNKRFLSLLRMQEGKLHVLVGEQYGVEGSRFEVETPTAVASAHGGEFLVLYDEADELTTVIGLERNVAVQATVGLIGPGVTVRPKTLTRIRKGRFPAAPTAVGNEDLLRYREGLAVLGTGNPREGIGEDHPAINGRVLRPEDLPEKVAGMQPAAAAPARPGFPDRLPQGESLGESLCPDIRVITQPIPEYRAASPGQRPTGGVQVDF